MPHGVVDHELGGELRVDAGRVAAEVAHGVAHGCEVDDRRHAGEVLEQDPGRPEGDLVVRLGGRIPASDRPHLLGRAPAERLRTQDVLEQDAEREGKSLEIEFGGERVQADELERAVSRSERCQGSEAVSH